LDIDELKKLIRELSNVKRFSIDVETTGLDVHQHELVGISVSWKKEHAAYIPLRHRYLGAPKQLTLSIVRNHLKPVLEDASIEKVGQNLKFDLSFLAQEGIYLANIYFDTMIASYCLDPSRPSHRLKDLVSEFLNRDMTRIQELAPKKGKLLSAREMPMDQIQIEKVAPYACADADCTFQLMQHLQPQIKEKGCENLFYNTEMPLVEVLAEMETVGIELDTLHLEKLNQQYQKTILGLESKAWESAGQEFNLKSSKQISFILFDKLKLNPIRKTKTGYSTDEDVLRILSATHDLPKILIEHRELTKLRSTYIEGLLAVVHPKTSRVHSSFNQTGTSTGRLSSSNPNLQNIPIRSEHGRNIRRAFIPKKGHVFLSADYSQIDLRVLAHLSGDPVLSSAFRQGADIHRTTASEVFGLKLDQVTEEQRKRAKAINFGIIYGQQAYGLSQGLGITMSEAQAMIDHYFTRYSGIKDWIENTKRQAKIQGYVKTFLGHIRYLPEINSKNGSVRAFAERMAMNTPVQGTSSDIIKTAMIKIHKILRSQHSKFHARMLVQVHDDLLFEVPEEELNQTALLVKDHMENAIKFSIPILVDLKTGKNWADMHPFTINPS